MLIISVLFLIYTAGIDFGEVAIEVRFSPFEQLSCISVSIIDNHVVGEDGVKSFTVTLFSDYHRVVVEETRASARIIIQENDGMQYKSRSYTLSGAKVRTQ